MLISKKSLSSISTAIVIFAQPLTVLADNVSQDLKSCAIYALSAQDKSASTISVRANGLEKWELDHSISGRSREYKMLVTDKASGNDYGVVSCVVSNTGKLLSASFES